MSNPKIDTLKHTIVFEGRMPADEMDRHALHAVNPEIVAARDALSKALADAGYPHTVVSHVFRPRTVKAADPTE